ncbi:MAG: hypothetical protein AB8B36_13895 [Prochlorococcus sp.]|tara:strand:- start:409 stop:651 length:243 start_codon:yes stop_codon:yes gene_type:complete
MQIYEVSYTTIVIAKVMLTAKAERELRRDCEVEPSQEIEEYLASDYLDEVAEAINDMIKLPEKFKAGECRVEINSIETEQ